MPGAGVRPRLKQSPGTVDQSGMSIEAARLKSAPVTHLALIAGLLAALLIALLLGAPGASASPPPAAAPSQPGLESEEELEEVEEEEGESEEEESAWEEGWEAEELGGTDCELGYEALEEGLLRLSDVEDLCAAEEEWEAEAEGRSPQGREARPSCVVRGASARVATRRNRLKLTIGYAVAAPTRARIEIRAGKRKLATVSRRLGGTGVIRLNKRVGKRLGRQLGKQSNGGRRIRLRIELPRKAAACPSRRLALLARR